MFLNLNTLDVYTFYLKILYIYFFSALKAFCLSTFYKFLSKEHISLTLFMFLIFSTNVYKQA